MIVQKLLRRAVGERLRSAPTKAPDDRPKAALIFGVGAPAGIGAAVARRASEGGLAVFVCGRSADKLERTATAIRESGGQATAVVADASDAEQIAAAFRQVDQAGFALELVVHNVGSNRPAPFLQIKAEQLERSWRADCLSGFFVGQQAIKAMQPNGRGSVIFTGASASLRGKAGFAEFAMSKAGLRSLAQSMARDFGPKGIHVAHVVIDGMVNGDRLRRLAPDLLDRQGLDGALSPDAIATCYWRLHQQHRSAWTHELDLRPFAENW